VEHKAPIQPRIAAEAFGFESSCQDVLKGVGTCLAMKASKTAFYDPQL
jgi:hypothetical protein